MGKWSKMMVSFFFEKSPPIFSLFFFFLLFFFFFYLRCCVILRVGKYLEIKSVGLRPPPLISKYFPPRICFTDLVITVRGFPSSFHNKSVKQIQQIFISLENYFAEQNNSSKEINICSRRRKGPPRGGPLWGLPHP